MIHYLSWGSISTTCTNFVLKNDKCNYRFRFPGINSAQHILILRSTLTDCVGFCAGLKLYMGVCQFYPLKPTSTWASDLQLSHVTMKQQNSQIKIQRAYCVELQYWNSRVSKNFNKSTHWISIVQITSIWNLKGSVLIKRQNTSVIYIFFHIFTIDTPMGCLVFKAVSKITKNIYWSNTQVTFELYFHFRCLHVLYSK